jgi:hypothetical protein
MAHITLEFLKIDSQLLETGLQTPSPNFFRNYFFYKNSMYPNMICFYKTMFGPSEFLRNQLLKTGGALNGVLFILVLIN